MLCKHSFVDSEGQRCCGKKNILCRYPDAPDSDQCKIALAATAEEARRAGQIIKRFCVSQSKASGCEGCPLFDMCNQPPYAWRTPNE